MSTSYKERSETYQITTIMLHREHDRTIIDWLKQQANNSEAIRRACYREIEAEINGPATVDPESIRGVIEDSLAGALGDMRQIVQAALDNALDGLTLEAGGRPASREPNEEVEELLAGLDVTLEVE